MMTRCISDAYYKGVSSLLTTDLIMNVCLLEECNYLPLTNTPHGSQSVEKQSHCTAHGTNTVHTLLVGSTPHPLS